MNTYIKCDSIKIENNKITMLSKNIPVMQIDYDPQYPIILSGLEIRLYYDEIKEGEQK